MGNKLQVNLLSDTPTDEDAFGGHKRVAAAIAELVGREDGGKAIAVEGGWGSGKSSIVRMLQGSFRDTDDAQHDTKLLVFDAWSHDGDPLRRVFLEELTQLCVEQFTAQGQKHWDTRKKREITGRETVREETTTPLLRSHWSVLAIGLASLYPLAIIALGALIGQSPLETWMLWLASVCVLIGLTPFLALFGAFVFLCVKRSNEALEDVGHFILFWNKRIDELTTTTARETSGPTSIEFQRYFSELVREYLGDGRRRLVVVLDNLDRVPEATARVLWSTLRLFADCCDSKEPWSKRIWFMVPYDRDAAAALWGDNQDHLPDDYVGAEQNVETEAKESANAHTLKSQSPSVSAAFFDKTFQIRFVVPPLHIADWEAYLDSLIEHAMPGYGSIKERHRVYRLSERLADEKGRPPSPRHLKLYVNDIGALVRQYGDRFPIDHLALYTIQRRQGRDIRLWITSGAYKSDVLAQVMPDEEYVYSLLCIYFGTDDQDRALTLTLRGPLRIALRNGDGGQIRELANIPGFWNEAEIELGSAFNGYGVKQEVVVNIGRALENSGIIHVASPRYEQVIPDFALKIQKSAHWIKLDAAATRCAEFLLRVANNPQATNATFARLVGGAPEAQSVASVPDEWAAGTVRLIEVAVALNHEYSIRVPGDAAQTIACLAALNRHVLASAVIERLSCECPGTQIQSMIAPAETKEWSEDNSAALSLLHSMPEVAIQWNELFTPISARVTSESVARPEAKRLLSAMFDLCERLPDASPTATAVIARHHQFYVQLEKWSSDPHIVASLIAIQLLSGTVERAPTEVEKPGHAFLKQTLSSANEHQAVVSEFVELAIKRSSLALTERAIANDVALGEFYRCALTLMAERDDVAVGLPINVYLREFNRLRGKLGENLGKLTTNLLNSENFKSELRDSEIQALHAGAHCQLIESDAFSDQEYQNKVFEFLRSVEQSSWETEIWEASEMYDLLVACSLRGWTASGQFGGALEAIGRKLYAGDRPNLDFADERRAWTRVYKSLDPQRRGTMTRKFVDLLSQEAPPDDLSPLIALLGDDFAARFAEATSPSLVRQVAEPIVKGGDITRLTWLMLVVKSGSAFWDAAPADDRGTLSQTLRDRIGSSEDADTTALLRELAQLLEIDE